VTNPNSHQPSALPVCLLYSPSRFACYPDIKTKLRMISLWAWEGAESSGYDPQRPSIVSWTPERSSRGLVGLATGAIVRCAHHSRISISRATVFVRIHARAQNVVGILGRAWEPGGCRCGCATNPAGGAAASAADGSTGAVPAARWPVLVLPP